MARLRPAPILLHAHVREKINPPMPIQSQKKTPHQTRQLAKQTRLVFWASASLRNDTAAHQHSPSNKITNAIMSIFSDFRHIEKRACLSVDRTADDHSELTIASRLDLCNRVK